MSLRWRMPANAIRNAAAPAAAALLVWACAGGCGAHRDDFTLEAGSSGEDEMPVESLRVDELAKAHDGDPATRWTTNAPMKPWFYLSVKLPKPRKVSAVILDARPAARDFPRAFVVEVARGGGPVTEVMRCGKEATRKGVTTIRFVPPRDADLILVTLTEGQKRYFWSVYEMKIEYAD